MPASLAYDSLMGDMAGDTPAVNFITGFFKLMLVNGYMPNQGADATRADVTNETTGTGYAAGGMAATITPNLDTTGHVLSITLSPLTWSGANTFSATGGVLYQSYGGAASGDPLVDYIDFGGTVSCIGGTFTVTPTEPLEFTNT